MAKDRIDRNELADKIVATAGESDDPLRAMAELLADFVMEAEVTQKIGTRTTSIASVPSLWNKKRHEPTRMR